MYKYIYSKLGKSTCIMLGILIVLLLLLIYIYARINWAPKPPPPSTEVSKYSGLHINLENIDFKTGDLIFLSGDTQGEKVIRWLTGNPYTHVAIVIVENGIVYLFEADIGQKYRDGPRVIALADKLKRYHGFRVCAYRPINKPIENSKILKLVDNYVNLELDDKMTTWAVADYPLLYDFFKDDSKIFCSEIVADVLQKLGVLKYDHIPAWYSPKYFYSDTITTTSGWSYGKVEIFDF